MGIEVVGNKDRSLSRSNGQYRTAAGPNHYRDRQRNHGQRK